MDRQQKINYFDNYVTGLKQFIYNEEEMQNLRASQVTKIVAEINKTEAYMVKLKRKL